MSSIVQFENAYNIQSHKIQENEENDIEVNSIKLMLLGKETVGKTSFKSCLLEGKIPDEHIQTFIDAYYFDLRESSGKEIVEYVRIQDSAGQEEFQLIIEQMIFYNNGFFIIYSIDDYDSFQQVQNQIWQKILTSKQDQNFFAVLIGNKKDLEENRKVSFMEGQNLANKFGIPFHEVSLKNDPKSAKVIFNQLVLSIKKQEYQYPYYTQQYMVESNQSNISSVSQTRSKMNSIHSIDPKFQKQVLQNENKQYRNQQIQKENNCCCSIF
ncbi:small guanosine triphosphatase family (GTPase)-like Ras family protein (macronuclear) [Tetrahymena thermophila SB210]|uniref:small monomeric GTPase n=1 Tax=Tetrahymena thermophila (strain SB210) TaxID=312017 RepID=I7MFW6_TETTS|nr:small guanosine triphosphatase family (GTPase)-like Ras family protein [Tetrahymena thermophila SB210]EAS00665.3 small guanosine triphosphatase family (GTPase)-like Ras family protein [Tetrahymena thermophila SB210]|eukprot:XP_001020910.3 small guanosine triphosphatase family (GTPase)-like Ras family protein [Tetrahymena thermophila SB210]